MNDNLPAVRVDTTQELVNPTTDSWTAVLGPVVELARSICGTDFVPESMRNNVAGTTAAIMYGRELGLPPMTALGSTHMIKGRVGVSAEILRALVLEQGHEIVVRESSSAQVVMAGRRKGTTDWTVVTWTLDDARRAKLGGDNWTKYPRQMLAARASAELCRLIFADVIHGMAATEELEEIDAPAIGGPGSASADGRTKVQRKTRTAKTDDGVVSNPPDSPSGAAPSSPPLPPLPGEEGYDEPSAAAAEAETGDGAGAPTAVGAPAGEATSTPAPSSPEGEQVALVDEPRMINRAMQKAMFKVFGDLGITDDAERLHVTAAIVGRTPMHQGKPSSNGLTAAEYQLLVDALARCKTRDHVEALVQMAEDERARAGEQLFDTPTQQGEPSR